MGSEAKYHYSDVLSMGSEAKYHYSDVLFHGLRGQVSLFRHTFHGLTHSSNNLHYGTAPEVEPNILQVSGTITTQSSDTLIYRTTFFAWQITSASPTCTVPSRIARHAFNSISESTACTITACGTWLPIVMCAIGTVEALWTHF